jgi:hypothetical protein
MWSSQGSGAGPQEWVEEADVFLWRPAPSTLFLGGWPTTTVPLWAGIAKVGLLPIGGSVGGTRSSVLHLLAPHANVLSWRGLGLSPHQRGLVRRSSGP